MQFLAGHDINHGSLHITKPESLLELLPLQQSLFQHIGLRVAQNFGSEMMTHVLATLLKAAGEEAGDVPLLTGDSRLVIHMAHDSNLQFIREMLGLHWTSPGWISDFAAPGDMLAFELSEFEKRHWVRIVKISMSPMQQRENKKHNSKASTQPLAFWACEGLTEDLFCPLDHFAKAVTMRLRESCVRDPGLKHYLHYVKNGWVGKAGAISALKRGVSMPSLGFLMAMSGAVMTVWWLLRNCRPKLRTH
mmetsp:Transcript_16489/g.31158  ORF Transcript_16489/g.31158 Transcript_16489/m.31158 type:complete len:248 (+) Transcript_16489:179-922(+)